MSLSDFVILRPPFERSQEEGMAWLAALHTEAEKKRNPSVDAVRFRKVLEKYMEKVCCKKDKIARRGGSVEDVMHQNWDQMQLYNVPKYGPEGCGFGERGRFFSRCVDKVFQQFYSEIQSPPDDLIHVTCTGYQSPSGPQRLVVKKGWEKTTTVTHAYHMGCMGAVPAIRMALGFTATGKKSIDIVHTELCSLHLNPSLHSAEQLVGQSLFADGLIKYTLLPSTSKPSLRILAVYEELIPHTAKEMEWVCEDWGLKMTLSKEIPNLITQSIESFVKRLEEKSKQSLQEAIFAIHPGGPKIINQIREKLELSEKQVAETEKILYNFGNMSSATLPHIWEGILKNPAYRSGSVIVSLAFAPGMCMSGVVLEKVN